MRTNVVLGKIRWDVAVLEDDAPVTGKTLKDALASLLTNELPAAFKTQLEGPLAKLIKDATTIKVEPKTEPKVEPVKVEPKVETGDPVLNARLLEQDNSIKQLQAALKKVTDDKDAAEKRADDAFVDNAISEQLGKYTFVKPESGKAAAAKMVRPEIERNEKGELIANNLPLADYVKNLLTVEHDYMLAGPTPAGGTGAGKWAPRTGTKASQLEDIKPGMSDAAFAQAAADVLAVL